VHCHKRAQEREAILKGIALEIFIWPLGILETESKNWNKKRKENVLRLILIYRLIFTYMDLSTMCL
jgi:hypothetical protein